MLDQFGNAASWNRSAKLKRDRVPTWSASTNIVLSFSFSITRTEYSGSNKNGISACLMPFFSQCHFPTFKKNTCSNFEERGVFLYIILDCCSEAIKIDKLVNKFVSNHRNTNFLMWPWPFPFNSHRFVIAHMACEHVMISPLVSARKRTIYFHRIYLSY